LLCSVLAAVVHLRCAEAFGFPASIVPASKPSAISTRGMPLPLRVGARLQRRSSPRLEMTADDPADLAGDGESADWREFRARLVAQEKGIDAKDGSEEWAYAGAIVEQGTVLMGAEGELGFSLRQQYFHKVVMLVVSQEESFTKALIVNRPTSRTTPKGWRVWYGGDVQGINAPPAMQEWTVLHRLTSPEALEMSVVVMEGISRTTLPLAEAMVAAGQAKPDDFWVLCGYAGWGPGQLQMEIDERKSWHVAAASVKVVNELMDSATSAETLAAGVPEWEELMSRIGMRAEALASQGGLADKMLREYARVHLGPAPETGEDMVASLMQAALRRQGREDTDAGTPEGTVVVSALPTPFALNQQFLHKAVILVLDDSDQAPPPLVLSGHAASLPRTNRTRRVPTPTRPRPARSSTARPRAPRSSCLRPPRPRRPPRPSQSPRRAFGAHPRGAGPPRLQRCARPGWARCLLGTPLLGTPHGAWASAASTARARTSCGFTPRRPSPPLPSLPY